MLQPPPGLEVEALSTPRSSSKHSSMTDADSEVSTCYHRAAAIEGQAHVGIHQKCMPAWLVPENRNGTAQPLGSIAYSNGVARSAPLSALRSKGDAALAMLGGDVLDHGGAVGDGSKSTLHGLRARGRDVLAHVSKRTPRRNDEKKSSVDCAAATNLPPRPPVHDHPIRRVADAADASVWAPQFVATAAPHAWVPSSVWTANMESAFESLDDQFIDSETNIDDDQLLHGSCTVPLGEPMKVEITNWLA